MKKYFIVFSIFLIVWTIHIPKAHAVLLAPFFDIKINEHAIGDATFHFDLEVASPPFVLVDDHFDITTKDGVGTYFTSTFVPKLNHVDITQNASPDWGTPSIICVASDPATIVTPIERGVSIHAAQFSSIVCDFTNTPIAAKTPVIIVPGIMGSTLTNSDKNEVWMNLTKMVISKDDSYLDELILPDKDRKIKAIEVIKSTGVPLFTRHIFDGLFDNLEKNSYQINKSLFPLPYDWRMEIVESSSDLKSEIEYVKLQTGLGKINIVAHSMGGLLVKEYIKNFGGDSIGKFIDLSTPHFGAPKSFQTLQYGDTDISILNKDRIKMITQNMPAVYELLPSQKYFISGDKDYSSYVFNGDKTNKNLNFLETKQYLKDQGRNATLVDRADAFHQELDNLNPADYGVKTFNIVGCGTPTLGQFLVLGKKSDGSTEYDIKMINGDGTVPLKSAQAIPAQKTYYVKNAVHATMPSTPGVKELVTALLSDDSPSIAGYSNISLSESDCPKVNGTIISVHSPITLDAYDGAGNHTGPNANGDIEQGIPSSDYEVIEDNKFVFLPVGGSYIVKGTATGSGSFDARAESVVDGEVTRTNVWNNIPLNSKTKAQITVGTTLPTRVMLDFNGDGVYEQNLSVSTTTPGLMKSIGITNPSGNSILSEHRDPLLPVVPLKK